MVVGIALGKNLFEAFVRLDGIVLALPERRLKPFHLVRLAGKGSFRARRVRRSLDKVGAMPLESGLESPDA